MASVSRNAPEEIKRISTNMAKARTLLGWQVRKWIEPFVYYVSHTIFTEEDVASWVTRYQPRWNELFAASQNLVTLLDVVRLKLMEEMPAALAATLHKNVEEFEVMLARLLTDLHADVYDRHLMDAGMQLDLQDLERRCDFLMARLNFVVKGVDKLVK